MQLSLHRQVLLAFTCSFVLAATPSLSQTDQPPKGLHSVALSTLGATAQGMGAPWNKDWPARHTLLPGHGRPLGALFGAPMTGAELHIRLVIPVDIKGIELFPLDYRGVRQISRAEIYIEDEKVATVDLAHNPGKGQYFPVEGHGQHVMVKVTGEHPPETKADGSQGPTWGGWNRVRVYSTTDVEAQMAPPTAYQVADPNPDFIAPTSGTLMGGVPEVRDRPRVAEGHPRTLWDREDIARFQALMQSNEAFRDQVERLRTAMDERMTQPLGIPQPRQNEAGEWIHLPGREVGGTHNELSLDIANLGTLYALTGEPKYGEFAKRLLLAYAEAFPNYGVGARRGFRHDPSKVFDQRLGDATWLIQIARGYDLIYNLSMPEEERRMIEDDLIRASANFIAGNHHMLRSATNWSAIATTSIFIAGVATGDQELIDLGLFGWNRGRSQNPWWEGESNPNPTGMELHFSETAIRGDGLWTEGAMGYQFMAMQALVTNAEIMWRMGIDLYSYNEGIFKRLFDSPLEISYPNLRTPAINDSGHGSVVGREAYLYEYGYLRYGDPRYRLVLAQTHPRLAASFQQFPVSVLWDPPGEQDVAVEWRSANFHEVGYGILRNTTERGTVSLLIDYGPIGSHAHPDKLNLDIWGFGERLLPDPGMVWYEDPMYRNWYRTTLAHNTLVVDELSQKMDKTVRPDHLVYAPAETVGLQRARVDTAYSGVTMDRSVFVTPEYTLDIFGGFAQLARKMDLAWHPVGEPVGMDLKMEEFTFPEPVSAGYSELDQLARATTDAAYTFEVENTATRLRLVAAGGEPTEVITGRGHLQIQHPPTLLQRRETAQSVWVNAFDYSGEDYVLSVRSSGGLADGYALADVETRDGQDIGFVSFASGEHQIGALQTDALQAMVRKREGSVVSAFLGGGTTLVHDGFILRRDTPGLAYAETVANGAVVVGNPSPSAAEVRVDMPGIADREIYQIDTRGKRMRSMEARTRDSALVLALPAAGRVELAVKGQPSMYETQQAMLRLRQQEQLAEMRAREEAMRERAGAREADAEHHPLPEDVLRVVQAPSFTGEGGGTVRSGSGKRAAIGSSIFGWDSVGHWLEYTVEVPATGYYHFGLVYCSDMEGGERGLEVNGEQIDPDLTLVFPATGGWANNSDDWRFFTAENEVVDRPLLVKLNAGENLIRLTNLNGKGVNVDYLVVFSPDVEISRELSAEAARNLEGN